jgi:pantoate kinase
MDKLERIGHLVVAALLKAPQLRTLTLDSESRAKVADLMKRVNESLKRIQTLSRASEGNGKGLNKRALDSALDELIKTFVDANKKLDDLLAKAKE